MADELTHLDAKGRARMVDIGEKPITRRVCEAQGEVRMSPSTLARITDGTLPKGEVLATARLAGIHAAKRTHAWIPLCHPLPLDGIEVEFDPDPAGSRVVIRARAGAHWRTGVEMEALVAVSAAGLTIYDMCKAIDREMTLGDIQLLSKSGGKSGDWARPPSGRPPV